MHIERTIGVCSPVIYRMVSDNKCPQISTRGVFLIGNTADIICNEDIAFNLHKSTVISLGSECVDSNVYTVNSCGLCNAFT